MGNTPKQLRIDSSQFARNHSTNRLSRRALIREFQIK
nr:MAG TPA: hypothetical protein [Caudoviricetes sp.]